MAEFIEATLAFPTALFSFLLVVAVGYWVVVLLSLLDLDLFDAAGVDADGVAAADSGIASAMTAAGLGGVPVTVVLTVLIAFAWFFSLAGNAFVGGIPLARAVVLPVALGGAYLGTRSIVVPVRRLLPHRPAPSRMDFVGRHCVVRTGQVGPDFGQAEVTADDGSTAIIQVRLAAYSLADAGWTALIYDYDAETEAFWITPAEPAI
ncbi:hypothetical protein GCM10009557_34980 [Virgisporangium ochraceum]|uniref:DUF1449 family protein n=1 Tax=Virgisporangium ochraceum TaxID=65505 RepID=A0A8J3ZZ44_9ACTN|nr:hypothetical protein [Virgisporangium ochraceum]GIJ70883.1 hypothetical protein Voc01_058000 [Virgisporangium ochraceum]